MASTEEPSYIDYDTFLAPDFSPTSFANDLVLSTNDPTDTPLDLSTPLSRVLFDVQEVDIHIDNLTTKSAVPLLDYTQTRADASSRILDEVSTQLDSLNEGYKRLEKDVIERYEKAEQVRLAAERLCQTLRLGRVVSRCLNLGRQLETQMEDLGITTSSASTTSSLSTSGASKVRDNHRSMVSASHTILELRSVLSATPPSPGLNKITFITTLRNNLLTPLERNLTTLAQQTIREFSISSLPSSTSAPTTSQPPSSSLPSTAPTFTQSTQTKSTTLSALRTLYLLSPCPAGTPEAAYEPKLLLAALTAYLQANLTASLAGLARALATLPSLDRTLAEVGGRCANVVALEAVLGDGGRGRHPNLVPEGGGRGDAARRESGGVVAEENGEEEDESSSDEDSELEAGRGVKGKTAAALKQKANGAGLVSRLQRQDEPLLPLLLAALDTNSLPSYFWRTLASNMTARVVEILNRGGVSARTLRSNKDRVAQSVRECVLRTGSVEGGKAGSGADGKGWEREAAVMVGSIVGVLGR